MVSMNTTGLSRLSICLASSIVALMAWLVAFVIPGVGQPSKNDLAEGYAKQVQPLLKKYCLECHSSKAHKGDRPGAI
jgi:hypothetical protein